MNTSLNFNKGEAKFKGTRASMFVVKTDSFNKPKRNRLISTVIDNKSKKKDRHRLVVKEESFSLKSDCKKMNTEDQLEYFIAPYNKFKIVKKGMNFSDTTHTPTAQSEHDENEHDEHFHPSVEHNKRSKWMKLANFILNEDPKLFRKNL